MTDATPPLLQLEGVTKAYRSGSKRLEVLRQIDMTVAHREMVAVVGPSGSGKTTLLNLVAGLDTPDSGRILLDGRQLNGLPADAWDAVRGRELGFVFQFNQLLPEFSALENVMMPGMLQPGDRKQLKDRARDLLDRMGMSARLEHRPAQLSGGEQQRVAIARALINQPKLVLADEPTGSLDVASGQRVFDLLQRLQEAFGVSLVVVTHNPALADMCARIHTLGGGADTASTAGGAHV